MGTSQDQFDRKTAYFESEVLLRSLDRIVVDCNWPHNGRELADLNSLERLFLYWRPVAVYNDLIQ